MSSSSGYNTDEDSLDIHQSEYNYNQASILSSVFYDVKDLTLRKRRILPHSSSSKQFKFDERIMYRTENNSSIISKEKDNRNLIKLLALLAFLSLACIFFFIPLTINTETQFLENSRQIISNATNHFQQWTSDNLVKLNPRKLLNKEILYLPLTLASNAANAIHSGFMQFGNGFWTLSTVLGQSLNIVVNFTARCLQSILEIFLLPLSWIPNLPEDITSIEIFTVPGKVFGLTFEFLKGSFNFVGNGIYSITFLGKKVTQIFSIEFNENNRLNKLFLLLET